MDGPPDPAGSNLEGQAERWLAQLRDGNPAQKAVARRELAAIFEVRGMINEAVELLVANARAGYRNAQLFESLARLYRTVGNEYLAASAALEAARLRERGPRPTPPGVGREGSQPPGQYRPSESGPSARPPGRPAPPGEQAGDRRWEPPLRAVGWVTFAGLIIGALAVGGMNPVAAVAYAVSAGALGLFLARAPGLRGLFRVPTGPLGDGLLLFVALLLFLIGGSLLPRGTDVPPVTEPPARTPGPLYLGTPTPSPAAPAQNVPQTPSQAASPAADGQAAPTLTTERPTQATTQVGDSISTPGPGPPTVGSVPSPALKADAGTRVKVVEAGTEGVRLRPAPGAEEVLKVMADGAILESLGEEREDGGRQWRRVRDEEGLEGWVAADFLAAIPFTPTAVAAAPTRQPSTTTATAPAVSVAAVAPTVQLTATTEPKPTVSAPAAVAAPPATSAPPPKPQATATSPPATTRLTAPTARAAPSGFDCPTAQPIKGNHSSSGEWIYHTPRGQFYTRTKPEECFATEADASRAGYRPSQR